MRSIKKIKFRFWDKEKGEFWDQPKDLQHFVFSYGHNYSDAGEREARIVFAGQYIGIEDKNGKEIYEGDVVYIDEDGIAWYVVYGYFGDAKFYVCNGINSGREIEDEQNVWIAQITSKEKFELEVIGNIYENPELIK